MFPPPFPKSTTYLKKKKRTLTNITPPLQAQNSDPISGLSSEGYKGPGMVQSPPAAKK